MLLSTERLGNVLFECPFNSLLEVFQSMIAVNPKLQAILLKLLEQSHTLLLVGLRFRVGIVLTKLSDLVVSCFDLRARPLHRPGCEHLGELIDQCFQRINQRKACDEV